MQVVCWWCFKIISNDWCENVIEEMLCFSKIKQLIFWFSVRRSSSDAFESQRKKGKKAVNKLVVDFFFGTLFQFSCVRIEWIGWQCCEVSNLFSITYVGCRIKYPFRCSADDDDSSDNEEPVILNCKLLFWKYINECRNFKRLLSFDRRLRNQHTSQIVSIDSCFLMTI